MAMDQERYNALYLRFQRQVSIPNTPDKLDDKELEELILALKEDAATAGLRKGTTTKKTSSTPKANITEDKLAALLKGMANLTGGKA